MATEKPICLDFETRGIERRPKYPPEPVGVSIRYPGDRKSTYYAFGHPTGNNCTKSQVKARLTDIWRSGAPVLGHNMKFDLDVAEVHFGLKLPSWERVHDTMFLLFLDDPDAFTLALKPASERILDLPPEERDTVKDWLTDHKIIKRNQKDWGAHIWRAPPSVVGPYANGDVDRTLKLYQHLLPKVRKAGALTAYDRERRLMPILLRNEREGMRCDVNRLRKDAKAFQQRINVTDEWLRKRLRTKDLNVDSDEEVADALEKCKVVTQFVYTDPTANFPGGQRSVSKKNLTPDMFTDERVANMLGYRNRLSTCLSTFALPWLGMAEESGGIIYTNWNQVKQTNSGGGNKGARTGRISSNPNFQNIPKDWYDKDDFYLHPCVPSADLIALVKKLGYDPTLMLAKDQKMKAGNKVLTAKGVQVVELPLMRSYILPDKGAVFCHRDFNQQELRILAHFEDGKLCKAYQEDPTVDIHIFVMQEIHRIMAVLLERRPVKIINFGIIFGQGAASLAMKMHTDVNNARELKKAHRAALPDLKELEDEIKRNARNDVPVITWGGRPYYCEPPHYSKKFKKEMTFEYKQLNKLVQGSAADCTKEALIRYDERRKHGRFMCTVHDECNISTPKQFVKQEMKILKDTMESIEFDVPMITDGKIGPHWGALTKYID